MKINIKIVNKITVKFEEESGLVRLIAHPLTGHLVWKPF